MNSHFPGRFGLTLFVMLILGCHSAPLKSPVDTSLKLNSLWLRDYKEAQMLKSTAPFRSCELFKSLALEPKFPANEIARLRAWETCDSAEPLKRSDLPAYLNDLSLDIALMGAVKLNDKAAQMELATEKSKQRLPQNEKLKWNELALARARELKDKAKIEALTKRQYIIAPRLNPDPSPAQWLMVASDLRNARKFEQAREFYEKIIKGPEFTLDEKITAHKGIRLSYKNARRMDDHIEASKRLVEYLRRAEKLNPKSIAIRNAHYDAEIYLGRAIWTMGQADAARRTFETAEKRLMGRVSLAELYWLLGRMAEERNEPSEVSRYMELALKERITDDELRDKVLWYSAWNERRQKNHARAAEILGELNEKTQSEFTKVRVLYWLGKTQADLGKADESKATFEKLCLLDPLGYYGLLAHRQLGLAISFKRAPTQDGGEILDSDVPLNFELADWLVLVDEKEALEELLNLSIKSYAKQKKQTDEGWTTLFRFYAKGGLFAKMYEMLSALPSDRRKSIVEKHPELLFPQPFLEDVKLAALQYNVDEELIYGIMRQESAFDPRARSGADAFGLMQVLPEVAENIAFAKKISYLHMDDLYVPKTNIPIGAAHIRELLDRHRGRFILAVASYNASEKAIANWMKTRFRGDALEFIEEIPYEETRIYVRLVMRNLIFYSLLKSKSASIDFPAWVLKLDAG